MKNSMRKESSPSFKVDVSNVLVRLGLDPSNVESAVIEIENQLKEVLPRESPCWSDTEAVTSDVFTSQNEIGRRTLQVVTKVDPFVRPYSPAPNQIRLQLRVPGGPEMLGLSTQELGAVNAALNLTNSLIGRGVLHCDTFGNLTAIKAEPVTILGSIQEVHWWGTSVCFNEAETQELVVVLTLVAMGLGETGWGAVPAVAVGLSAAAVLAADALGGNRGVCIYKTPLGTIVIPNF